MNEKERDQLIRDTFDQCLSGIDTMPSLRPVVNKQLDGETPKARKHFPLRRLTVPAAALALCVCLIVTGNYLGMLRWPDVIRDPETRITASPVPLSQPEGTGAEAVPSPSADTADDQFYQLLEEKTPLNAVCEKAGIRFEVHSAEVYDDHTRVLCSLQDLEGGRIITNNLESYPDFSQDISGPSLTGFFRYGCIREEYRAWYYLDFWYDGIDDLSDRMVTISAQNMPLVSESGKVTKWVSETWSVQIPLKSILMDTGEHPAKYSEEFFAARLRYTVNEDGTATIAAPEDDYSSFWTCLAIPEKLDGHFVTAIADNAFEGYTTLKSVTLPDAVTSIGAGAFRNCVFLDSADLPEGLETIGDEAFRNTNLQKVILPDTLEYIGENAFTVNHPLGFIVSEGSWAQQYCQENDLDYTIWVTFADSATPLPEATPAVEPEEWHNWGTYDPTPAPLPGDETAAGEDQYDERMMEIYTPLDQFIAAWEDKNPRRMADLCVDNPDDGYTAYLRTQNTMHILVSAITPQGCFIEDALDLEIPDDDSPVTVSVRITDIPRQAKYRFNIRFVRQWDNSWLIDPLSLESCEELEYIGMEQTAVLEYPDLLAKATGSEVMGLTKLLDITPGKGDVVDILVPVNAVCEKDGIRLEVVAAAAGKQQAWALYTLQDLEGDRIGLDSALWSIFLMQDINACISITNLGSTYIEQEHLQVSLLEYQYAEADLSDADRPVTFSLSPDNVPYRTDLASGEFAGRRWEVQVQLSTIRKDTDELYRSDKDYASRFTYRLNEDGTAVILGANPDETMYREELVIPGEIDGHTVTAIADSAFELWQTTILVLPDSIVSIGSNAFNQCGRLQSVSFPEGLQSIGENAFRLTGLDSVRIPASVTQIGKDAFLCHWANKFVCTVPEDSYAQQYCEENNIPYALEGAETRPE